MKQIVIRFGLLAACLLILMQLGQYTRITGQLGDEVFFSLFAVLFLAFGYLMSRYIQNRGETKEVIKEGFNETKTNSTKINRSRIDELKISKREYEVLELINRGYSNHEISKELFISESTVKSHVSSIFNKLDVKRRTQAVKAAKEMEIL